MKRMLLPVLGLTLLLLSACGKEDAGPGIISTTAPMEAKYDTTTGVIPFPNNLLFTGSTTGKLNFTDAAGNTITDTTDPKGAMNQLDGFSTVAPITTTFSLPIDPATITSSSVRVFEVATAPITSAYAVGGIVAELVFGTQFKALPSPGDAKVLVIKPTVPLKSNAQYMVVVTNALKSTSGEPARSSALFAILKHTSPLVDSAGKSLVPGRDDATAAKLEGLRKLTQAMLGVAASATPAIAAADVAVAWSFKTQTLNVVLPKIMADTATDPYANSVANFATVDAIPSAATQGLGRVDMYTFATAVAKNQTLIDSYSAGSFANIGAVVIGAVANMPYYLEGSKTNPNAALTARFTVDAYGSPTIKSLQPVPFLITIPNTAGPWKVAIFQHGFTVDKSAMFGIANTLASQGYATIAIDAVLHGSRTFDIDVVTQVTDANGRSQTTASVPDGVTDTSGTHYLNLTSLLTSRDNIRQSVADLIHLTQLLKVQTMDVVNNTTGAPGGGDGVDLDVTVPFVFVGHSNGGIIGTVLAGVVPTTTIAKYVLANPGGDYGSILQNSLAYGPVVEAGLAAKGVVKGSAAFNAFFVAAQTVVDDGDPLNYAAQAKTKPIFLLKTTPDGVVPNPQTDNLSLALGLKQVSGNAATVTANTWPLTVVAPPLAGNGFVNYTAGSHSSFLSPQDSATATTAMQTDAVTFIGSGAITTSNTAVTE